MNLAAIERRLHPYLSPRWLDRWHVRRARLLPAQQPATGTVLSRSLYIDVSVISKHDAGTGIQRVVRGVATQLLNAPPDGWTVHPVAATQDRQYRIVCWPGGGEGDASPLRLQPGDVFLGLDFAPAVRFHRKQLLAFKQQGGELWFLVHDLLPIRHPEWFSDKMVVRFRKWLSVLASLADGFYCNSPQTEADLTRELMEYYEVTGGFRTQVIPLGWDLQASHPSLGLPPDFGALLEKVRTVPSALMVGTIEPRKGHDDVLSAFDLLWRQGEDYDLVVVGRPGWKTEAIQTRLRQHPRNGRNLHWLSNASDEALAALYNAASGVIVASRAEGFGLPLVEALGHGKFVLARDLPIFRQQTPDRIRYFPAQAAPITLADVISDWLPVVHGQADAVPLRVPSWKDTAGSIMVSLANTPA